MTFCLSYNFILSNYVNILEYHKFHRRWRIRGVQATIQNTYFAVLLKIIPSLLRKNRAVEMVNLNAFFNTISQYLISLSSVFEYWSSLYVYEIKKEEYGEGTFSGASMDWFLLGK